MPEWRLFCKLSELSEGAPISKDIGGVRIGVYRVGGDIRAIDDICPHAMAYLSDGFQDGAVIECPLHQARFSVVTGQCLEGPILTLDLKAFDTKTEGDDVFVMTD